MRQINGKVLQFAEETLWTGKASEQSLGIGLENIVNRQFEHN